MKHIYIQTFGVLCLCLCVLPAAMAGVPAGPLDLLHANFENKTLDQPIGTGGAVVGEPVQIFPLDTNIVECAGARALWGSGDKCLQVKNDLTFADALSIRWQLIENAEITSGLVSISFDFIPSALDRYQFAVREADGATSGFLSLRTLPNGTFFASDANGTIPINNVTYSAGQVLKVRFDFDMDTRKSQASVNGRVLFAGRSHGVVSRGVGQLFTGYQFNSAGKSFRLNNMLVETPLPIILDASFDDQPLGQPLAVGGASANQPVSIAAAVTTQIVSTEAGGRSLNMSVVGAPAGSPGMRWQFLDNIEVLPGIVAIETDVQFANLNSYTFSVRETVTAAASYGGLFFTASGEISVADGGGSGFIAGASYQADVLYRLRFVFDQAQGTYSAWLDERLLFADRAHGVSSGRGIGAVLMGFSSNGTAGASMRIDDLQVGASAAADIVSELAVLQQPTTGIVGLALTPTLEIGALNVFDELIPDGTWVMVDVANGPAGAALSHTAAATVAGMARFPNLSASPAGGYVLRARADRAQVTTSIPMTVSSRGSSVFRNGFETSMN